MRVWQLRRSNAVEISPAANACELSLRGRGEIDETWNRACCRNGFNAFAQAARRITLACPSLRQHEAVLSH